MLNRIVVLDLIISTNTISVITGSVQDNRVGAGQPGRCGRQGRCETVGSACTRDGWARTSWRPVAASLTRGALSSIQRERRTLSKERCTRLGWQSCGVVH